MEYSFDHNDNGILK